MNRTLRSELRRAGSRKLTGTLAALVFAAVVVGAFATFLTSSKFAGRVCPESGFGPTTTFSTGGADKVEPFQFCASRSDERFHYADLWKRGATSGGGVIGTTVFFAFIAFVLGASLVGAEYRAGTVATALTWEPRRSRLLLARLAAAAVVAVVGYVLVHVLMLALLWPVAVLHGTTAGVDAAFWRDLAFALARGAGLAAFAAVLGGCLALFGRATEAATAFILGYLIGIEAILGNTWHGSPRWMLLRNAAAFLTMSRVRVTGSISVTPAQGALYLACLLAVAVGAARAVFRRRDVA